MEMKKFQCDNCGAAMTIDDEQLTAVCEYCGTTISLPDTHPEYAEVISEKEADTWKDTYERKEMKTAPKKIAILIIVFAWVIIIAVFGIVFMEMSMLREGFGKPVYVESGNTELNWPTIGLAAVLPEPDMENGEVFADSEEHFSASIYGAAQQDFDTYATACRKNGFDIATEGSDSSFCAYNAEGYYLDVFYWDDSGELNIYLDAPEDMMEFVWPVGGLAAKLPQPESELGRVISDDTEQISILVYVDSKNVFDNYVEECKSYGFTENHDYYFMDNKNGWYEADHKDGYHLDVSYDDRYYKKMEIRLDRE